MYIIDGIRTPIGSFKGSCTMEADDMAALVIKELCHRNPWLQMDQIDDMILELNNQAGER